MSYSFHSQNDCKKKEIETLFEIVLTFIKLQEYQIVLNYKVIFFFESYQNTFKYSIPLATSGRILSFYLQVQVSDCLLPVYPGILINIIFQYISRIFILTLIKELNTNSIF